MKSSVNEATSKNCPTCSRPLLSGAPAGLCPACLLAQGAETESGAGGRQTRFVPPTLAEVAALFPQLEVLRLLGAGGMGAVYQARQPALDRFVALKVLPAGGDGANFEERFNREARALARLSHPNIVAVHEFGQAGGLHYFLMEFVDGANLRQLEQASRLSPREALQLIPQICDALQYAHDEGVVHRDIKPENVLVDRKGRVKIADFGLAKILGHDPEAARLTVEGQVMGTPHYMAPEQVERPLAVDHRADIYSLGVVFYEMLTGDLPLGKFAPPSRKVQVDVRLDEIVLRALENDPARRYQQASEVKSGVATVVETPTATSSGGEASPSTESIRTETSAPVSPRSARSWWPTFTPGLAGFVVWLLVLVTVTFVTATLPQKFMAIARVSVDLLRDGSVSGVDSEMIVPLAIHQISSLPVLEQAADKLKLTDRWAGKVGGGTLSRRDAAIMLGGMLSVRRIPLTHHFEIECWGESAADLAEFANAVAEASVEQSRLQQPPTGGLTASRFEATLIDRAVPPLRAARPNVPLNVSLGFVGGGVGGGLAALFVGWMRRRVGIAAPVEDRRRSRLVAAAAVAVVMGVPFAVILKAALTAQPAEQQRARAVVPPVPVTTHLKFLAWQEDGRAFDPAVAWHPDGTAVTSPDELEILRQLPPSGSGGAHPRLVFWFWNPAFAADSEPTVSLDDEWAKSLEVGSESEGIVPEALRVRGWRVRTLWLSEPAKLPRKVTVRLDYNLHPPDFVRDVPADFTGPVSLTEDALLSEVGTAANGQAFLTIVHLPNAAGQKQFWPKLELAIPGGGTAYFSPARTVVGQQGEAKLHYERFEFDGPLAGSSGFRIGVSPRVVSLNPAVMLRLPAPTSVPALPGETTNSIPPSTVATDEHPHARKAKLDPQTHTLYGEVSDGRRVTLLALRAANSKAWMRPDNTPATDFDGAINYGSELDASAGRRFDLAFQIAGLKHPDAGEEYEFPQALRSQVGGNFYFRGGDGTPAATPVQVVWPESVEAVSFRVGMAMGEWQTIQSYEPRSQKVVPLLPNNRSPRELEIHTAAVGAKGLQLTIVYGANYPSWNLRAVAATSKPFPFEFTGEADSSVTNGSVVTTTYVFPGLSRLDQVTEFRAQACPLEWVEFEGIQLPSANVPRRP